MKESITFGQKEQLVNFVKDSARKSAEKVLGEIDLDKNQFQQVIEGGDVLTKAVAEVVEQKLRELSKIIKFPVAINYVTTIKEMIARGKYDWTNNDITSKNFPTQRTGEANITVELVHFNRSIGTDEALRELDKMGYRPAELHELLALGEKYPDLQREFPIIALGSVWQRSLGYRGVAYLSGYGSERLLLLYWLDDGWRDVCRFAVVRK